MEYAFGALAQGVFANPENLSLLAKTGEKLGFEVMWFNDHIVMPRAIGSRYPYTDSGQFNEFGETGDYLEQLTVLSYVAAQTSRVKLLTSVMVVPYRDPVLTAKILATADVLSEGRVIVGCGAGWLREEFKALGRPPFEERGSVTEEYIRVFKNLWPREIHRTRASTFRTRTSHSSRSLCKVPIHRFGWVAKVRRRCAERPESAMPGSPSSTIRETCWIRPNASPPESRKCVRLQKRRVVTRTL